MPRKDTGDSPGETTIGQGRSVRTPIVVGIGASSGGLQALEALFACTPRDTGLAFVVVQHLEPRHPSALAQLLARRSALPVAPAADGARPEPDHVYVNSPNTSLTIEGGAFRVAPAQDDGPEGRIDRLLRSLAADREEAAIGLLLSGTGTDGTAGLRAVKEHGGFTLAQDPSTARHGDMARTAIEAGLVDEVHPVEELPAALAAYAERLTGAGPRDGGALDDEVRGGLDALCGLLREHTGHDFSGYKEGTLVRRIRRRIHVRRAASVAEYLKLFQEDAVEPQQLLKDLLIGVTQFFRDPATFEEIERVVLPRILGSKASGIPVRIWVPGCASGEEAYSLAILVHEFLAREKRRLVVQIFATDLEPEMIAAARAGSYAADIEAAVSPHRLGRYFVRDGARWQVVKELREMCIFSVHSLVRDPPFSGLDLVSCRNVLIYLEPDLQQKVVPLFHYALRRGGYLLLGPAEGLVSQPELFEPVDKKHRIFRRRDTVRRVQVDFPVAPRSALRAVEPLAPSRPPRPQGTAAIERLLLDAYVPACAVVNDRGDIQYVAGPIGKFLASRAGPPPTHLGDAVRDGLRLELRTALQAAVGAGRRVVRENVPVELDDGTVQVRLTVRPVPGADGLFAVVIQERALDELKVVELSNAPSPSLAMEQLEAELRDTRSELRAASESAESANEELRCSNEELISTNEELQSANEELQTSKEELQSLNEELETVNAELQRHVDELAMANSDLRNLMASTEIATVFLDGELRITRFTPAAAGLLGLIPGDVGRPLSDLAPRFEARDVTADARAVLSTLSPLSVPVHSAERGAWFILRVLPYRAADGRVAGVVVTLVDVSELKRAEDALRQSEERFRLLVEGAKEYAIVLLAPDGTVASWNAGAERLKGYRGDEILGQPLSRFYTPEDAAAGRPASLLEAAAREGRAEDEGWRVRGDGTRFWANVLVNAVRDESGALRGFVKVTRDFTDRRRMLDDLQRHAELLDLSHDAILVWSFAGGIETWNRGAEALYGFSREEARGRVSHRLLQTRLPLPQAEFDAQLRERRAWEGELLHTTKDGREVAVWARLQAVRGRDGVERVLESNRDITERKRAEDVLRESEQKYTAIFDHAPFASALLAEPDGTLVAVNDAWERVFGYTRAEALGKTAVELGLASDADARARMHDEIRRRGSVHDFELEFLTRSGERRIGSFSFDRIELGGRRYHLGTAVDVTERRLAEQALRRATERERFLADILESSTNAFGVGAPDGRLLLFNRAFSELTGYSREELEDPSLSWARDLTPPEWREREAEVLARAVERREAVRYEKEYRRKDGSRVPIELSVQPIFSEDGSLEHFRSFLVDVTERKRSEEAILRSRRGLARLADASLRVVRETDLDGMLQAISEAALALTGARVATCGHGDVAGRILVGGSARVAGAPSCSPGDMFKIERGGVHMELVEGAASIRLTDAELRAHRRFWGGPAGHVPMRGLLGARMVRRGGQVSGMILVTDKLDGEFTDDDESLLLQLATIASQALQHVEARLSLEAADRSKNDFLAVLSHELRNPLAPIRNSIYVLDRAEPGSEQARRAQAVIDRQIVHLTRLVDDLLDVTRISRGKVQLHREQLDAVEVVRRAVEDHRSAFTQGEIRLQVSLHDGPLWVNGDRTRIAQVVGNLLQNAAKFTDRGGCVTVALERVAALHEAVLRVRDTGVGIAPEMLRRVFEPFAQADTTLDRSKGGLGLGLALVKGLVEMHGGTATVESAGLGKGAEFVVRLPLAEAPGAASTARAPVQLGARRVLLIEDNVDAARTLREVLELESHTVEVAFAGPEGIEKARAFQPEVVLCDIGLPGMDGFEVARTIRADPSLADVRLVALTGYAAPEDVARSKEVGFDAHIAKPPAIEALRHALDPAEG